jgi:hypothetical protein
MGKILKVQSSVCFNSMMFIENSMKIRQFFFFSKFVMEEHTKTTTTVATIRILLLRRKESLKMSPTIVKYAVNIINTELFTTL